MDTGAPNAEGDYAIDAAGEVRGLSANGWPEGYLYGATRYADVILRESFPSRYADLIAALEAFQPTLQELRQGGGGRTVFVKRFDESLASMLENGKTVWGKQNVTIEKSVSLDGTVMRRSRTRGHEIDMFGKGTMAVPIPGIAVEMEWNNKDPFYDRDLNNFQALHREGTIAIGVIVTRGPALQSLIGPTIHSKDQGLKYGQSTTHWDKLIPKVNLGGGGECPLLLIGIEPPRIQGVRLAQEVLDQMNRAKEFKATWRKLGYAKWADAKGTYSDMLGQANALMPPLTEVKSQKDEDDD
jgi:hypothetical protein